MGPMESERKAFRLVGGVLVEKTVGDILPSVTERQTQVSPVRLTSLAPLLLYQSSVVDLAGSSLLWLLWLQIRDILGNLETSLKQKEKMAADWKTKYGIQTQQEREMLEKAQRQQG